MGAPGYCHTYSLHGVIMSLCSYFHKVWASAFIYFMLRISLDGQLELLTDCRRWALAYREHL